MADNTLAPGLYKGPFADFRGFNQPLKSVKLPSELSLGLQGSFGVRARSRHVKGETG